MTFKRFCAVCLLLSLLLGTLPFSAGAKEPDEPKAKPVLTDQLPAMD